MANEATLIVKTELPINFTCADGTGIEKGTLLKITDPMTASASTANSDMIAGIAASEKIANSGVTKIGVYRRGIFKMTLSGSCVVGDPLRTSSSANHVARSSDTSLSGSKILGTALETGTTGETILVELNPMNYVS